MNCVPAAEAAPLLPDGAVAAQLPPGDDDARVRRRRRRELVRVGHLVADSKYKIEIARDSVKMMTQIRNDTSNRHTRKFMSMGQHKVLVSSHFLHTDRHSVKQTH